MVIRPISKLFAKCGDYNCERNKKKRKDFSCYKLSDPIQIDRSKFKKDGM